MMPGVTVAATWYRDSDADGYGDAGDSQTVCTQPAGYVADNIDCDDTDTDEHPGQTWYKDTDDDAYSDGTTDTASCTRPAGYKIASELTATSGDCDDDDAGVTVAATWYRDSDGDGFGDAGVSQTSCTQPAGYVSDNTDCDDGDVSEHPGQTWYKDADADGYSDGTTNAASCTRPAGYKGSIGADGLERRLRRRRCRCDPASTWYLVRHGRRRLRGRSGQPGGLHPAGGVCV